MTIVDYLISSQILKQADLAGEGGCYSFWNQATSKLIAQA